MSQKGQFELYTFSEAKGTHRTSFHVEQDALSIIHESTISKHSDVTHSVTTIRLQFQDLRGIQKPSRPTKELPQNLRGVRALHS